MAFAHSQRADIFSADGACGFKIIIPVGQGISARTNKVVAVKKVREYLARDAVGIYVEDINIAFLVDVEIDADILPDIVIGFFRLYADLQIIIGSDNDGLGAPLGDSLRRKRRLLFGDGGDVQHCSADQACQQEQPNEYDSVHEMSPFKKKLYSYK